MRMRSQRQRGQLLIAFPVDPGADQRIGEHAAGLEELVILLQGVYRLGQGTGDLRNGRQFFASELVR